MRFLIFWNVNFAGTAGRGEGECGAARPAAARVFFAKYDIKKVGNVFKTITLSKNGTWMEKVQNNAENRTSYLLIFSKSVV
ncbi:MAG: hypothetical protein IJ980_03035 [Oscillospiraceae bacterium]|nr:hypothetical protein [Oscillospiraceae bacterium]